MTFFCSTFFLAHARVAAPPSERSSRRIPSPAWRRSKATSGYGASITAPLPYAIKQAAPHRNLPPICCCRRRTPRAWSWSWAEVVDAAVAAASDSLHVQSCIQLLYLSRIFGRLVGRGRLEELQEAEAASFRLRGSQRDPPRILRAVAAATCRLSGTPQPHSHCSSAAAVSKVG